MGMVTCDITVSVDGCAAGPGQSAEEPLGRGGESLHRWQFEGGGEHTAEVAGILGHGAYIMGRNMFGPPRVGGFDEPWRGWWGEEPPYRAPVFVLTHTAQEPVEMAGGTTFHFVTGGPQAAFELARDAAGERTFAIAGGASTVDQFLAAGLIDELRLHIAPIVLGGGERLFAASGPVVLTPVSARATPLVTHVTYRLG
ncbi:dihydrofolate reductase family protein [Agrococcus baldri]|uniref:Deaminase reductase n=1 Tax=Agrococcus baldri TaxID=153730 RepID=A0AA87REG6_9MICO|nr:dihydrofolate reductase family protein [Agrococcus baldri]GEK78970.1 deaminase reductase [Agrococcus baldri]